MHIKGHILGVLSNFWFGIGTRPMPQLLTRGNHSRHRGETVCKKLATLTVRNLIFSRCQIWSIFTVFRYFSIVFDIFRSYTHRQASKNVQNCLPQRLGVAWGLRERSTWKELTDRRNLLWHACILEVRTWPYGRSLARPLPGPLASVGSRRLLVP